MLRIRLRLQRRTMAGAIAVVVLMAAGCGGARPRTDAPTSGPIPSPTRSESPAPSGPPSFQVTEVASVDRPLGMAVRAGDPTLYVVSKRGAVWAIRDGRVDPLPVLDLSGQVSTGR